MKKLPYSTCTPRLLRLFIILIVIFSFFAFPAFMLGGVTWDEIFDFEGVNGAFWHGINTLKGLNPDLSTITFDLEYFGNATRWPTYLFWRLISTTPWESFHGVSRLASIIGGSYVGLNHLNASVFGLLGILLTSLIGFRLDGIRLAVLSGILMLLLPTWLGHSWMNSKDIPFASSYLLYSYGSILFLTSKTKQSSSCFLSVPASLRVLGIALLLGSRIGSILFIFISESIYLTILKKSYLRSIWTVLLGLVFGFILTPQAWNNPFGYPFEAIAFISARQATTTPFNILSYLITNLLESLPSLLVIGLLLSVWRLTSRSFPPMEIRAWTPIILQLLLAPVLLVIGSKSLYNELRHILFIYPPLCLLSASGWTAVLQKSAFKIQNLWLLHLLSLIGLSLLLLLAVENIMLSPYHYVYRSDIARALYPGEYIHRDYWGFSSREALARCLKDDQCFKSAQQYPLYSSKWDINPDIITAYSELLPSVSSATSNSSKISELSLTLTTYPRSLEHCTNPIVVSRKVFFPKLIPVQISKVALCSEDPLATSRPNLDRIPLNDESE